MFNKYKKILILFILTIISFGFFINSSQAGNGAFDDIWGLGSSGNKVPCSTGSCTIDGGINSAKGAINDKGIIRDGTTATQYIQKLVSYLLTFITLIATIYVIYAGFRILTSSGEDEVIKNSKKTIIYVIVGIVLIRFAYEIAFWAVSLGDEVEKIKID